MGGSLGLPRRVNHVLGRAVTQVVSSWHSVPRAGSELLLVVVIRTTRNEHVLEGYPRVSPLRDDSRLEYNGDAGFGREVVAESASNVFYSIRVTRAHTIAVAGRGLPCNRKLFAVANTTEKKVVLEGGVKVWSMERGAKRLTSQQRARAFDSLETM